LKLKIFLLISCLIISCFALAQKSDSLTSLNRKYKREIGIDFQGFFRGAPGTTFIYKIRNDRGKYISVASARNFRFQLNLEGNMPLATKITYGDTTMASYYKQDPRELTIQLSLGLERVRFYDRFNFYYGIDVGPSYSFYDSGYDYYRYLNSTNNQYYYGGRYWGEQIVEKRIGMSFSPFVGVKYRFAERFSVSLESSFVASVFMKTKEGYLPIYANGGRPSTKVITKIKETGIEFYPRYLRLLSINYHIK
jgi:hypothetical protein